MGYRKVNTTPKPASKFHHKPTPRRAPPTALPTAPTPGPPAPASIPAPAPAPTATPPSSPSGSSPFLNIPFGYIYAGQHPGLRDGAFLVRHNNRPDETFVCRSHHLDSHRSSEMDDHILLSLKELQEMTDPSIDAHLDFAFYPSLNVAHVITTRTECSMEFWMDKECSSIDPASSEVLASEIIISLLTGIDFLHQRGILHRDVSPRNLYATSLNGPWVLGNFHRTRCMKPNSGALSRLPNSLFTAPETHGSAGYGQGCDNFSGGRTIQCALMRLFGVPGTTAVQAFLPNWTQYLTDKCPSVFISIVKGLTSIYPENRLTLHQVRAMVLGQAVLRGIRVNADNEFSTIYKIITSPAIISLNQDPTEHGRRVAELVALKAEHSFVLEKYAARVLGKN